MLVKIINIYSNEGQPHKNLKGAYGNGFYIEFENEKILFDLGWKGSVLLHNLQQLNINPDNIDKIIFSHGHMDHTKALPAFLNARRATNKIKIVGHPNVREMKKIQILGFRLLNIAFPKINKDLESRIDYQFSKEPVKINQYLTFTGEIRERPEKDGTEKSLLHYNNGKWEKDPLLDDASLILETIEGLVLIGGCMHSGLLNTCAYVSKLFNNKKIIAIIGGTHMIGFSQIEVNHVVNVLKEKYDFPKLYLNHCTGKKVIEQLKQEFGPEIVLPYLVGTSLTFDC